MIFESPSQLRAAALLQQAAADQIARTHAGHASLPPCAGCLIRCAVEAQGGRALVTTSSKSHQASDDLGSQHRYTPVVLELLPSLIYLFKRHETFSKTLKTLLLTYYEIHSSTRHSTWVCYFFFFLVGHRICCCTELSR